MDREIALSELVDALGLLTSANRPLRLRLAMAGGIRDDLLLPQRLVGRDSVCGGFSYHVLCLADDAMLALKDFIGVPAEVQIVTDSGGLRCICGIVSGASSGESDGALATYELLITDALTIMERRTNTRVFRNMNELDIITTLVEEWQRGVSALRGTFELQIDAALMSRNHPAREFTFQHNESDAVFVRRLLKRRGIAWHFRSGHADVDLPLNLKRPDSPSHTLALFDDTMRLPQGIAGTVRYQRDHATLEHDAITGWCAVRTLQAAKVSRFSWDYRYPSAPDFMSREASSQADQGELGSRLGDSLDSYLVEPPHIGDDATDHDRLTESRLAWHELEAKHFKGEGTVRSLAVGEWVALIGHPELDGHAIDQRCFVITSQEIAAQNNLPKEVTDRVERLFADSGWSAGRYSVFKRSEQPVRYLTRFTCVRRSARIVPSYDPRTDLPRLQLQSAIVVGPDKHELWCDEYGRVKIRFPATRPADHKHSGGMGANDAETDSAWVRVASNWAGNGAGNLSQCGAVNIPRVGTEVLVDFLGGDPDKPIIVGQLFNGAAPPPAFSRSGSLPGNAVMAGVRSREIGGTRGNQLRFDDTAGQISAQLASDHGSSELNLGYLTEPRNDGTSEPRGEGAELRSDRAVAVRGAQGVLLDAGARGGCQLERSALGSVARDAKNASEELDRLSSSHEVSHVEGDAIASLVGKVADWDRGSNVDRPNAAGERRESGLGGGAPILAAHGQAGVLVAGTDAVMIGSQKRIEAACVGDIQSSAGGNIFMRAARALQIFAANLGIKMIAGAGNIQIEAHGGEIVIKSLKRIHLISGECIRLEAPTLQMISQGAQTIYADGQIADEARGTRTVKCAQFIHRGPGDASVSNLKLPKAAIEHDQQVQLKDMQSKVPLPNRRYRIEIEDGEMIEGTSDSEGLTERFSTKHAFAGFHIELLD